MCPCYHLPVRRERGPARGKLPTPPTLSGPQLTCWSSQDFTVFSVNHTCVFNRLTDFQVPARMPACPPGGCICAWFWVHSPDSGGEQSTLHVLFLSCTVLTSFSYRLHERLPLQRHWCNFSRAPRSTRGSPAVREGCCRRVHQRQSSRDEPRSRPRKLHVRREAAVLLVQQGAQQHVRGPLRPSVLQ
jgi:hypothetical protein